MCVDTEGQFSGQAGQIIYYWHDDETRDIIYANFYKWLETVVLAAEAGITWYRAIGDSSEYYEFREKNNPGYPKEVSVGLLK